MDIEILREFAITAKHCNMTEAARELNLTQSVLSRHISALEEDLSVRLFDRDTVPMSITPAGTRLLPLCCQLGADMIRIRKTAASLRKRAFSSVRVAGLMAGPLAVAARATAARLDSSPGNIDIQWRRDCPQIPFNAIRFGELDVAIEPFSDLIDTTGLESIPLFSEAACVVMDSSNPLAGSDSIGLENLEAFWFVTPRSNAFHALRKHLQSLCAESGPDAMPPGLIMSASESLEELLLADLGQRLVYLPRSLGAMHACEGSGLALVPLAGKGVRLDYHAFFLPDCTPTVRAYVEQLAASCRRLSTPSAD